MKKILLIPLSLVLLLSLLSVGCPRQPTDTATATGGVLNLYGIDPLTLDPAVAGDGTSNAYVIQLFSGLVRLDDNLEPVGDIAREWQVSQDGRSYTFYLRDDVYFHDGRRVRAQDFKYSWERALDPATGSQTAATYLGDIVGAREVLAGESDEISGLEVIGDFTLKVTIDEPRAYFLSKMTHVTSFVVDRANVEEGDGWWRRPNGSGPFKLAQWDEGSLLVLDRNGLYYGDLAGVASVAFHLWAGRPMDMYEMGQIDVTTAGLAYIDKVSDPAGIFREDLTVVPELSLWYIGFNTTKPPFDDVNIRRAFSQAIDKEKLVALSFNSAVRQADGILPPGMPGFNEALSGLTYDVERAKELIAASEYGDVSNLPPITITTGGWGGLIPRELEAVIYQWRVNLGVEVEVRQLEIEEFLYNLMQEKDEMFYWGWGADYPHPQNFLEVLFATGSENNHGEYSNPEVDALLRMAALEPDSELSLELYRQAEQKLVDDAAALPLWFGQSYVLVKSYIKGYRLSPLGLTILNSVSIEPY
ncbi:MAG: peptide ABC transporter substrate-binding protein [Dehalococcoidales bacterium]